MKAPRRGTCCVLRDARAPTGASVLVSAHERNAAIFTFRGANTLLEPKDIRKDALAVDLVYVSSLSNESADCFPRIVEEAKAAGALVAADPGIRQLSARQGAFRDIIGRIDILAINRHEAEALVPWLVSLSVETGPPLAQSPGAPIPELARRGFTGGGFELSLLGFFHVLQKLGPRWVVVTDGRDGAYIGTPSGVMHCPAVHVAVVGTAGAGDAYNSTFAACIAEKVLEDEAALFAAANAAAVVAHLDTQTGLLGRAELDQRVAKLRSAHSITRWAF